MEFENNKKKKVMATELKNVRLAFVSYVKEGANGLTFDVIKNRDSEIIEDECYTDLINKVGVDENEGKQSKKTFKEMLLSLNPFKKNDLENYSEEDKIFIKEVGGMELAKKIQETLDSLNTRLIAMENNQNETVSSIETLKAEVEGKEGEEKEKLNKEISVKESLVLIQKTIQGYESQIKVIDQKIADNDADDDIDMLKNTKIDKEVLLNMFKEKETEAQKEIGEMKKANTNNAPDNTTTTPVETDGMKKIAESITEVSTRLETLENKRQKSNKLTIELDKDEIAEGSNDPNTEAFWGKVFD